MLGVVIKKLADVSASVERFQLSKKLDSALVSFGNSRHPAFLLKSTVASGFGYAVGKIYNSNPLLMALSFTVGHIAKNVILEFSTKQLQVLIGNGKSLEGDVSTSKQRWSHRLRAISFLIGTYAPIILFGCIMKKSGAIPSSLIASALFLMADNVSTMSEATTSLFLRGKYFDKSSPNTNYLRSLFKTK